MTCSSGHITSGVKQAGIYHRRLYGTREVIVVLRAARHQLRWIRKAMVADQIVVVMKSSKEDGAKGLACSGFVNERQPCMWDD